MEGREGRRKVCTLRAAEFRGSRPRSVPIGVLVVQVHPACPSPTCPKRMGSSAKTRNTCPQLQAGCVDPEGGRAGEGGCTHLAHKGSAHLRREEALAGPGAEAGATMGNSSGTRAPNLPTPGGLFPTSRCPRGSEVALAGCGGTRGRGAGLMVAARAGSRPSPGGRVPGRAAEIHPRGAALASRSPACPLPARPPARPPGIALCK